jgi:hypothetical protein
MSATVNWTDATGNWNNSRLDYFYSTTERGKTFNLTGSGASLGIEQTNTLTLGMGTIVQGQGSVGLAQFPSGTSTLKTNPNNSEANTWILIGLGLVMFAYRRIK